MAKRTLLRLQFESEFHMVGVVCSEFDYRFCWLLNSQLQYDFRRINDFSFFNARQETFTDYSAFECQKLDTLHCNFFLVNNRSVDGAPLFPTPPGIDFLILIKAEGAHFNFNEFLKNLRSIRQITAAYRLDDVLGKNKETFLYDFELFIGQVDSDRKKEDVRWVNITG